MDQLALKTDAKDVLKQLLTTIGALTLDQYTEKIDVLSYTSIGEHTRHIIELFQQLMQGYECAEVNYDDRNRDLRLQQDIDFAAQSIMAVIASLDKPDKSLIICTVHANQCEKILSNFARELMYNIEHCIHHQAIIKIALVSKGVFMANSNFGMAKSTLMYQSQCAQ